VIDRGHRDQVLQEIEFSLSDCSDQKCAIEMGRLLAADIMVIGSINRIGSRLALDLKALDVETSRVIGTFYQILTNVDEAVDQIHQIGGQFVQNFTGKLAQKREVLQYEDLVLLQ